MNRRSVLRAFAAAPIGAHAAAEQAKLSLAGASVFSGGNLAQPPSVGREKGPETFTDFAAWFRKFGEHRIRESVRQVSSLDPDLVEMRLPLNTKFRMQRERNFKREVEDRRRRFYDEVSIDGVFKWWP